MEITTKDQLVRVTHEERRRLEDTLARLTDEDMLLSGVTGLWSIKDMLAHIAHWEGEFLRWYRTGQRGERPERPDPDDIDPYNKAVYERYAHHSLADVRDLSHRSYRDLLAALDAMTEEELFTVGYYAWTGDEYPLAVYLRANADEHYAEHAAEIKAWLLQRGR